MELLKKSHSREMDKLKRSSWDGGDGLQTEVVQLQVEMENMSQKYMEEIENLKVCCADVRRIVLNSSAPVAQMADKWGVALGPLGFQHDSSSKIYRINLSKRTVHKYQLIMWNKPVLLRRV